MKKNRAFNLVVIIIVAVLVVGVAYYLRTKKSSAPQNIPVTSDTTGSQKFTVIVWNEADVKGPEGAGPVYFEYYNIPAKFIQATPLQRTQFNIRTPHCQGSRRKGSHSKKY